MERRKRLPLEWNGTIPCRRCGEMVILDRTCMERVGDGWLMECPICGKEFPVRYGDPTLPQAQRPEPVEPVALTVSSRRHWWSRQPVG